jgi:hypothetical protein
MSHRGQVFGDRVTTAPLRRPPSKMSHRGQARRNSLRFHLHALKLPRVPVYLPEHRELHLTASTSVSTVDRRHAGENAPPPRLPSASPRARPCHAGPPPPTDVVTVAPVTPRLIGLFWPVGRTGALWLWAE